MPYKAEKMKLPKEPGIDRRIKLSDMQKTWIRLNPCGFSQRKLAAIHGVSRRTIQFLQNPESLTENKKRRQERGGWKQYYDKEEHRETIKEHRRYKHQYFTEMV